MVPYQSFGEVRAVVFVEFGGEGPRWIFFALASFFEANAKAGRGVCGGKPSLSLVLVFAKRSPLYRPYQLR